MIEYAEAHFEGIGVAKEDRPSWIEVELRRWEADRSPSAEYRSLVRRILFELGREPPSPMFEAYEGPNGTRYLNAAERMANRYFHIQRAFVDRYLFGHDAARQLISHSASLVRLCIDERMSASEICRIASVRDPRFRLNWKAVQEILRQLAILPAVDLNAAEQTGAADKDAEAALFADLDLRGAIEKVGETAKGLGVRGEFAEWLADILINDLHSPYLLILHFQLLSQDHFDHAVTYAYEFNPRGQVAAWLTERYIAAGVPVAQNAFLNNAKATLRFDRTWVTGRTDNLRSASALASLLETMEELGATAKHELAAQIRALLERYLRVKAEEVAGAVPHEVAPLNAEECPQLLAEIAAGNTGTTGILEQRLVDLHAARSFDIADGWVGKGLGDSVFAPNTFRRKFGDVEFLLPVREEPKMEAFESHGGRLTAPYVQDHLHSFKRVLKHRYDELNALAGLGDWGLRVTFVAHSFGDGLPHQSDIEIDGQQAKVMLRYVSFADLAGELDGVEGIEEHLNEFLVRPVNGKYVHPQVRLRLHELLGRMPDAA